MIWWRLCQLRIGTHYARCRAIEKLGETGGSRAVKPLVALLNDRDGRIRSRAATALGEIGDAWAVDPLIALLDDQEKNVRVGVITALGWIGEPSAIRPLVTLLHDPDSFIRRFTVEALGRIGDPSAVRPLATLLHDQDKDVREITLKVLEKIGDTSAIEPLVVLLNDRNHDRRHRALDALEKLGWQPTDDTQCILVNITRNRWEEIVHYGERAIELLTTVLNRSWDVEQRAVVETLQKIGGVRTHNALAKWDSSSLSKNGSGDLCLAAEVVGKLGDVSAIEPLTALLNNWNHSVRKAVLGALEKLGWQPTDDTQRILVDIARSKWEAVVHYGERAVEPLTVVLNQRNYDEQRAVAEVLRKIGGMRAQNALAKWQEKQNSRWYTYGSPDAEYHDWLGSDQNNRR